MYWLASTCGGGGRSWLVWVAVMESWDNGGLCRGGGGGG